MKRPGWGEREREKREGEGGLVLSTVWGSAIPTITPRYCTPHQKGSIESVTSAILPLPSTRAPRGEVGGY